MASDGQGYRARNSAIRIGATATQLSTYKLGSGKIRICRAAESRTSSHALLWIFSTVQG
jgi:hypothetical protein